MSTDVVINIIQQAAFLIMLLSAPMLLISLLVGLTVSIFQATTQIQEATLTFVPKIVSVLVALVVFGPFIITRLVEFTRNLYMNIDKIIG